jgi:addiction module HigA family antidote
MIRSFGDEATEALFNDHRVRQFEGIARKAKRKLEALNAASRLEDLTEPPSNRLEKLSGDLKEFIRSASTGNGESFSNGSMASRATFGSWTIIKGRMMMKNEFAPVTPGEMLKEEFLAEYDLSQNQLARAIGISPNRITEIINNRRRITADTALRLGLYFGNSPEFWINLQSHYDLKLARRNLKPNDAKRIKTVRAA